MTPQSPATITELYVYPVQQWTPGCPVFNPALPVQQWARPMQAGENPAEPFYYQGWTEQAQPYYGAMSKGQAALLNIPEPSVVYGTGSLISANPCPCRTLNPGESVVVNPLAPFGGLPLLVTAVAAPPAGSANPTLAEVNTGINEIEKSLNLPQT